MFSTRLPDPRNIVSTDSHPDWYLLENPDSVASPALLIYPERIAQNLDEAVRWAGADKLRPHVKTHKMPQIIEMKLKAGITKFKCATIAEAEMTAAAGGKDVLLAYQMVGPNIQRLLELVRAFPETAFSALVDDPQIVREIGTAATQQRVVVSLLVDLNVGMNRTGIRPDDADDLYRLIAETEGVHPGGLHAYDGHIHETDLQRVGEQADAAFAPVWALQERMRSEGLPVDRVVGCGTPTSLYMGPKYDIEISSGTAVLWDAGQPTFTPPTKIVNAAVLLTRVISRPADDLMCVDLGYKAVSSEMQPPRATFLGLEDAEHVMQSEEHLVLRTPRAKEFPVGATLYAIPTHICPTVALHSFVWCVRDGLAEETWPVVSRTRKITI
jgi:D-serine deaminase-like pyridoxal phosphate-dependent protein